MATRQYFRSTRTITQVYDASFVGIKRYQDMAGTPGPVAANTSNFVNASTPPAGDASTQFERPMWLSSPSNGQIGWFTERFLTQTTLSGDIVFNLWSGANLTTPATARLRVRLYQVTAGGSNIETYLGAVDGTTDVTSTATVQTLTLTLPAAVIIAPNERLLVKLWMFLTNGSWPSTTLTANFRYDAPTAGGVGDSYIDLPGTIAFKPNAQTLALRRTTTIGIGTFMDLLPTFGSTAKTSAIVNTVASGTEIQWTKTAGGVLAEWISPRFKGGWTYPINAVQLYASESATAANISARAKVFRRKPDGTETLLATADWASATELGTAEASVLIGGSLATNWGVVNNQTTVHFSEDDRLILRAFIIPASAQVMGGSRTGTLSYDGPGPEGTAGSSYLTTYNAPDYKAETDPPAQPVPSGTSTVGWGNGQ